MKLIQRNITKIKLPDGKTDHIEWDDDLKRFGFRLRSEGARLSRTWVVQYRARGRTRRKKIGDYEAVTEKQARAAAKAILAKVALGEDPQGDKQAQRLSTARSLKSVAETHLEMKQTTLRPASYRMAKLYLLGSYFRPLHSSAITDITRADIASCLNRIIRDSGRVTAHMARSALSSLYTWALQQGIVEQNPVVGTADPGSAKSRDVVLSDSELGHIWRACPDNAYGKIIRLLICIPCRREEIGGLRHSESDNGMLILPSTRTKNKREHRLPLTPLAQSIIDSVPERAGRDFVFGGRSSSRGFTAWSAAKADLDTRLNGKVADWHVHDIRRSVATRMADLGVEPHIIEAVLGHYSGHRSGVAGVYNKSRYERQVKAALLLWTDHLQSIISGGGRKVLSFPKQETA